MDLKIKNRVGVVAHRLIKNIIIKIVSLKIVSLTKRSSQVLIWVFLLLALFSSFLIGHYFEFLFINIDDICNLRLNK